MNRHLWIPLITGLALLASGCVSYEGHYAPACPSFAGNTIEIGKGRFEWGKFTDQVRVDEEGKVVDAFPGYPISGSYRIEGSRVLMTSAGGETLPVFYLVRTDGHSYLYTEKEYAAWERDGSRPKCPLALGGSRDRQ